MALTVLGVSTHAISIMLGGCFAILPDLDTIMASPEYCPLPAWRIAQIASF